MADDLDDDAEEVEDEDPEEPEDLEEDDLVDLDEEDDIAGLDDDAVELVGDEAIEDGLDEDEAVPAVPAAVVRPEADEDEEEEEDEPLDEDVEASLDVILKERMVVEEDDDDDDEDAVESDERGESPLKVLPKQPGEFVCQSCFLVKHPSQLADKKKMLCRDCV